MKYVLVRITWYQGGIMVMLWQKVMEIRISYGGEVGVLCEVEVKKTKMN